MKNQYSISEFLSTSLALIITKIFYKKARLIRRPFYIRGKSSFSYLDGLTTGHSCRLDLPGENKRTLFIGYNCEMGDNVHIVAHQKVTIGNNVLMASKIFISDTNHGDYSSTTPSSPYTPPNSRHLNYKEVHIGDNVWIGENVCVLPGVQIGSGCIVGANSVVTKNLPPNCIAAGVPAMIIKKYDEGSGMWS